MKPITIIVHFDNEGTDKKLFITTRSGGIAESKMDIRIDGEFSIITDEWGNQTIYPSTTINHIEVINDY